MLSKAGFDLSTGFGLVFLTGTVLPFLLNPITTRISDNNQKKRVVYFVSFLVAILLMASRGAYSNVAWNLTGGLPAIWSALVQMAGVTVASWGVITVLSKNIYDGVIKPEAIIGTQKKADALVASQEAIRNAATAPADIGGIPVADLLSLYAEIRDAKTVKSAAFFPPIPPVIIAPVVAPPAIPAPAVLPVSLPASYPISNEAVPELAPLSFSTPDDK